MSLPPHSLHLLRCEPPKPSQPNILFPRHFHTPKPSKKMPLSNPNKQPKKPLLSKHSSSLATTLFFVLLFALPALLLRLLLHASATPSTCTTSTSSSSLSGRPWSGDLRDAAFPWNRLPFDDRIQPTPLKIAVFSRKWPDGAAPGGMERHAHTLHTALAGRGHSVHVFTSPLSSSSSAAAPLHSPASALSPRVHHHGGEAGRWQYNRAWEQFAAENERGAFDVVHSESVALPHWLARHLPNLAVSWHGIALESLQSGIFQDLARPQGEPLSPAFNATIRGAVAKVLNEIRFFRSYAHHVAISDSCGEMLRDVYQIPARRVHVILNGVEEEEGFDQDGGLGRRFRSAMGIPGNATLVLGAAGRLVKDKGHPLLHEAFSRLEKITGGGGGGGGVYLVVAGVGPWEQRYRDLGSRVRVLGSMGPAELRAFYSAIDVFVDPTLRPQGLDLTLMEAMMAGKPVMASRFPSIKGSVVVEEELGLMFAPNVEALTEALEAAVAEGKGRMAERGRACRRYAAAMFTARRMALAYERLFLCIKNETFCAFPSSFPSSPAFTSHG